MKKISIITTASILGEFGINNLTEKKALKKTIVTSRTISLTYLGKKQKSSRPTIITENILDTVNCFDDKQTKIIQAISEGDRKKNKEMNLRYKKGFDISMFTQFPGLDKDILIQYSILKLKSICVPIIYGLVPGKSLKKHSSAEIKKFEKQAKRTLIKFQRLIEKFLYK